MSEFVQCGEVVQGMRLGRASDLLEHWPVHLVTGDEHVALICYGRRA